MENPQKIWDIETGWSIRSKFKKFQKDHPREYASVFANLDKVVDDHLNLGEKLGSFNLGFFRPEKEGVYRVGQTSVPSAKESRLYVFPAEEIARMFTLVIGTKDGQLADINEAVEIARKIKKAIEAELKSKEGGAIQ